MLAGWESFYFIDLEDGEYKETIKNAREKLEVTMEAASKQGLITRCRHCDLVKTTWSTYTQYASRHNHIRHRLAGRSAECCVILALMVAPRGRALVFLNIVCGRQKIATSGYRAWGSRRRAEERTSPPDVICAMYAHQTHVHSWEAANWRSQYAWYSIEAGSEGRHNETNSLSVKVFPKSGGGPGKVWERAFRVWWRTLNYLENPVRARFAHQNERHLFHRSGRWRIQRNHQKMQGESWKFRWTRQCCARKGTYSPSRFQETAAKSDASNKILKTKYVCIVEAHWIHQTTFGIISTEKSRRSHRRQRIQFDDPLKLGTQI